MGAGRRWKENRVGVVQEGMSVSVRFRVKQTIKQAVQNVVLPVCYRANRGKAVDPKLVVFADAHHNSRPAAMELLYRRLKERGDFRIVEHYLDYGSAGAAAVAQHSMRFMQLYACAGYVVICDNFLPVASCDKRPETKVIQLWHACGCYKKFGYDAKDDIPPDYHGANVYRNADLVTVSGEAPVSAFASAMRLPERCVRPLGVSRTDLYFNERWRERCRKRFYEKYLQAKGKKVVLWAPTFRGNAGMPELVAPDLGKLQQELGEDYIVLARLHPHMMAGMEQDKGQREEKRVIAQRTQRHSLQNFACEIPTEELYPVVDTLIADYSSLIYEYLLFDKPLVLYVPDLEEYRTRRGFYMAPEEIPARIVTQEQTLARAVLEAEKEETETDEKRAAVTEASSAEKRVTGTKASQVGKQTRKTRTETTRERFLSAYMGACDGKATDRIVDWMLE